MNAADQIATALDNLIRAQPGADQHNAVNFALGALSRYDGVPTSFLDWLADHMDANPSDADLCRRVAGNVRKLAKL
jgi:hypothetical protein